MDLRVPAQNVKRDCAASEATPVGCEATWGSWLLEPGVGWDVVVHHYRFDELAMVCSTRRAIASAAATAHLAAYHNLQAAH